MYTREDALEVQMEMTSLRAYRTVLIYKMSVCIYLENKIVLGFYICC